MANGVWGLKALKKVIVTIQIINRKFSSLDCDKSRPLKVDIRRVWAFSFFWPFFEIVKTFKIAEIRPKLCPEVEIWRFCPPGNIHLLTLDEYFKNNLDPHQARSRDLVTWFSNPNSQREVKIFTSLWENFSKIDQKCKWDFTHSPRPPLQSCRARRDLSIALFKVGW